MSSTPEAKVKAAIKKILKEHGAWYAMPMGTGYGNSGVPDFICCLQGQFVAVEAKAGKGKPTALQEKNLRDIKESGGYAWVVNEENLDEFKEWVEGYRK